ncbi:MAG: MASE1 domain-containing protein [Patescibacteria group bacterium]|nr:MASE1 domain-containing protein [Patescibacteria group bacterium]
MSDKDFTYWVRQGVIGLGILLVYVLVARIGEVVAPADTPDGILVIAPSGVALAVFLIYGYRFWPVIIISAFFAYVSLGVPPVAALSIALGNTLTAFVGAYALNRYADFAHSPFRLPANIGLILCAFFTPVISASAGVASVLLVGELAVQDTLAAWSLWWLADVLGILTVTPLLLAWISPPIFKRNVAQYAEMSAAITATALVSFVLFFMTDERLPYYVFLPLAWAVLRTGARGITISLLTVAGIATAATTLGYGPFAEQSFLSLQIFIGTTAALFLVFGDVVEERRRVQRELKERVAELEIALRKISAEDEAKKEFLAIVAHELRNPMAAILSSAELIKAKGLDESDASDLLGTIEDRVRSMGSLLDDLLDISRISQKQLSLKKEEVSVGSVIERSVRTVLALMRSREHNLSFTRSAEEIYVEADPLRLEQIIVNLLNNAAKYTERNGSIELTAQAEGNAAVIRVRDSGIGISKHLIGRIFEPFFQGVRGKSATDGLGIGLSLTRQLVQMHGGTITASSPGENMGSEFTVRLPLLARLPEEDTEKDTEKEVRVTHRRKIQPVKNTLRILVVDDHKSIADGLGSLLRMRGHTVRIAYNGSEAVESAMELRPHAVILDIGLPDIDGYEVARAIRRLKYKTTLIALTGYGQKDDKAKAHEAGFDHHMTKPVGLRELEVLLRRVPSENGDTGGKKNKNGGRG